MKVEGNLSKSQKDVLRQQVQSFNHALSDCCLVVCNCMFTDDHLCSISVPEGPMRMTVRQVQQIRAIKDELGDNDDDEDDIVALERKMQSVGMPANVWKHAQRELRYFSC